MAGMPGPVVDVGSQLLHAPGHQVVGQQGEPRHARPHFGVEVPLGPSPVRPVETVDAVGGDHDRLDPLRPDHLGHGIGVHPEV